MPPARSIFQRLPAEGNGIAGVFGVINRYFDLG
jgi:hypothetical protein